MSVCLVPVVKEDYPLMLAWRNNPIINAGFYSQSDGHLISWEEHIKWIESRNKDWRTYMIIFEDRKVGVVTIGQLEYWEPETGLYVGEINLWDKGIGKAALTLAFEKIKERGWKHTRTTILDNNLRSIALYIGLGFKKIGPARPGESLYRKDLL